LLHLGRAGDPYPCSSTLRFRESLADAGASARGLVAARALTEHMSPRYTLSRRDFVDRPLSPWAEALGSVAQHNCLIWNHRAPSNDLKLSLVHRRRVCRVWEGRRPSRLSGSPRSRLPGELGSGLARLLATRASFPSLWYCCVLAGGFGGKVIVERIPTR
jgi:hypothetical protein